MLENARNRFKSFLRDEDGPTAIEYAVLLALIAAAVILSVSLFGTTTRDSFDDSGHQMFDTVGP